LTPIKTSAGEFTTTLFAIDRSDHIDEIIKETAELN
jgi:hypothetical protein